MSSLALLLKLERAAVIGMPPPSPNKRLHGLLNEAASQQKLHTLSSMHIISASRPNVGRTNHPLKYGFAL
jgi:hypothetical protein